MFKKILITLVAYLFLISNVYAAGSDGDSSSGSSLVKSNYDKAVSHIKIAKKHEKKGKLEKAKERYLIAQKLLIKSNYSKPNKADTLNYFLLLLLFVMNLYCLHVRKLNRFRKVFASHCDN